MLKSFINKKDELKHKLGYYDKNINPSISSSNHLSLNSKTYSYIKTKIYWNLFINKKKNNKMIALNSLKRLQFKNLIYYANSSKEWFNNVYSYNKSYNKLLVVYDNISNNLFTSYFNIIDKIKRLLKKRPKNIYSANKVYLSRVELKHTSTRLLMIIYAFNKHRISTERFLLNTIEYKNIKNIGNIQNLKTIKPYKTMLIYLLEKNFYIFNKGRLVFFKINSNILNYLIFMHKLYYLKKKTPENIIIFSKQTYKLKSKILNHTKLFKFNIFKFNNSSLNWRGFGLGSLLEKIYNKNIELKLIDLKSIHLNSDVFAYVIALKIRNRKNKITRVLKKAISMVKVPCLHTLRTFDQRKPIMNKNNIINTIKQQAVSGFRLEASGRLTKRLTAMRSVFKSRHVGTLKDIRSSIDRKSSVLLRNFIRSNLQYLVIFSKTRNGAFGLKTWVGSH